MWSLYLETAIPTVWRSGSEAVGEVAEISLGIMWFGRKKEGNVDRRMDAVSTDGGVATWTWVRDRRSALDG